MLDELNPQESKTRRIEKRSGGFVIYALHHPASPRVYIGKSVNGSRRTQEHSFPSSLKRYARLPRTKWIKSLLAKGQKPHVAILECVESSSALDEAEKFFIAYFRFLGIPLLNCTDGGDGVLGHRPTVEVRRRISKASREHHLRDPLHRKRIAVAYWSDPKARLAKREERLGKKWSAETKEKMSAASRGRKKSAAHREALSRAMKARCATPEWRAHQSVAQREAQIRPDVVARKSKATKLLWQDKEHRARQLEARKRKPVSWE